MNSNIPRKYSEDIIRCKPIEWNGIKLFPIKVSKFRAFLEAKEGLTLWQQNLPLKYTTMRYLDALYMIEFDALKVQSDGVGLLNKALTFLTLALRLPMRIDENGVESLPMNLYTDKQGKLKRVEFEQKSKVFSITSADFDMLRPLLAEQNGFDLPDESYNPELVEAEKDIASKNAVNLEIDFETLTYSVAISTGKDIDEVMDWPIRKFAKAEEACDRNINYVVCALTEAGGGKYTKGNPYPSWKYNKKQGLTAALEPLSSFQGRLSAAVEDKT